MVSINYQAYGSKGFNLRLRFYLNGETKFLAVNKFLKGDLHKKHWNQARQRFIPSAPYSDENNEILVAFKQKFDKLAISWQGSLYGFMAAAQADINEDETKTLKGICELIIEEQKRKTHADGSIKGSYEGYEKLNRRLQEFCDYSKIQYDKLLITDINSVFVNNIMDWVVKVKKGKGHVYISAMLHAVLARADKEGWFDMSTVKNCRWKGKNRTSVQKYHTLSKEQCQQFVNLTPSQLPKNPKARLYHDFCIFILYTGQSACDAITLRNEDIKSIGGVDHFIFKRRKISEKQVVPCAVPINDKMREIMKRWSIQSKDGYIFPIRNNKKMQDQKTNNGDIKHFIGRINRWLKKVGDILGCEFGLHTYTFRHTAITHYISKGVPTLYVANLMGTSVKNCENIYYNNQGDVLSRDKVLGAIEF